MQVGIFFFSVILTASFKSFRPKGVGSVTKTATSAPSTVSTTGQDVPGDASMMLMASGSTRVFTRRMTAGAITSPMFNVPWAKKKGLFCEAISTVPIGKGLSVSAFSGQTSAQSPQA